MTTTTTPARDAGQAALNRLAQWQKQAATLRQRAGGSITYEAALDAVIAGTVDRALVDALAALTPTTCPCTCHEGLGDMEHTGAKCPCKTKEPWPEFLPFDTVGEKAA